jgi:hypothetical protein
MGILVLSDNAGIGCANWVLRALVADIATILREKSFSELADWLTSDHSPVELYSDLDIRVLTKDNQEAFLSSIAPACAKSQYRGPKDWAEPSHWDGYINLFQNLASQADLVVAGKSPSELPNLNGIPVYNGSRDGPGWDLRDDV